MPDDVKTVRQWSLAKSIPYSTLLSAVRDGRLPAMRYTERGQIFVTKKDIDQFIVEAQERARSLVQEDED